LRKSCRRPFNQLYVHYNGNVVLCCCDWKEEVIFGNLMKDSLAEIFSGPVPAKYRENLARKNRNMKLCEVCNYCGNYPFIDRLMTSLSRLLLIAR
jgi:radical SAM protein with 4Fe4S-binding SPASM domain